MALRDTAPKVRIAGMYGGGGNDDSGEDDADA